MSGGRWRRARAMTGFLLSAFARQRHSCRCRACGRFGRKGGRNGLFWEFFRPVRRGNTADIIRQPWENRKSPEFSAGVSGVAQAVLNNVCARETKVARPFRWFTGEAGPPVVAVQGRMGWRKSLFSEFALVRKPPSACMASERDLSVKAFLPRYAVQMASSSISFFRSRPSQQA